MVVTIIGVVATVALVLAVGAVAAVWRLSGQFPESIRAIEQVFADEGRALRAGSTAFELGERAYRHDVRNRLAHYELRLETVERQLGIVHLPPDATGEAATQPVPGESES